MPDFELSSHAKDMLLEREISEEWLWGTLDDPDDERIGEDRNTHYTKAIQEKGGRILHVVVNKAFQPYRIVTLFFDRRQRKNV